LKSVFVAVITGIWFNVKRRMKIIQHGCNIFCSDCLKADSFFKNKKRYCTNLAPKLFSSYDDIFQKKYVTKTGMKKVTMIFSHSFSW
jgi:hypothetical protein